MSVRIKKTLKSIVRGLHAKFCPPSDSIIIDNEFLEIHDACRRYAVKTTTKASLFGLYKAVEYIVRAKIQGDIVECGVWKGGGAMVIARTLLKFGETHRRLYLYDTFAGMTEPVEVDVGIPDGASALKRWRRGHFHEWAIISLEEARANVRNTGYPAENLVFVQGRVEETIPRICPERIAVLRLDTDWYESTRHELAHLYPRLSKGGVVLIDDYGYWAGAKKATDEYFESALILLSRIDETVRVGVKVA